MNSVFFVSALHTVTQAEHASHISVSLILNIPHIVFPSCPQTCQEQAGAHAGCRVNTVYQQVERCCSEGTSGSCSAFHAEASGLIRSWSWSVSLLIASMTLGIAQILNVSQKTGDGNSWTRKNFSNVVKAFDSLMRWFSPVSIYRFVVRVSLKHFFATDCS